MAPASLPVTERIVDALIAKLGEIQEGATYYTTPKTITDLARFDSSMDLPAITVVAADEVEDDQLLGYISGEMRLILGLHLIAHEDVREQTGLFIADVKRAIRSDFTLDGEALDAHVTAVRRWPAANESGRAGATMDVLIEYRYRRADPAQVQ